jgi:hypothetical protein
MFTMKYGQVVFRILHLGLAEIFLHEVSVGRLFEPALLESVHHLDLLQSGGYRRNCFFKSHQLSNTGTQGSGSYFPQTCLAGYYVNICFLFELYALRT